MWSSFEITVVILLIVICGLLWGLIKDNIWIEKLLKEIINKL